jgi:signal transduction histidine kinase/DNA-binding response OmpR family regulator/ligand-binding sensor domain-containing protein
MLKNEPVPPATCRLLLLLICLLTQTVLSAQTRFTNQQVFGVEDGLPQSYISGITQDKDGFLWVSTLDGLSRYDGRKFKHFRHHQKDSTGLSGNAIYSLITLHTNQLVLMYDGLSGDRFDMQTFRSEDLAKVNGMRSIANASWDINQIRNAYNGNDYCFLVKDQQGAGWLNTITGKVEFANKANRRLLQDSIITLFQHSDGRLFLVSTNGVQVSDTAKTKFNFSRFNTGLKQPYPENSGVYATLLMHDGRLAVYDGNHVYLLNLQQRSASSIAVPFSPDPVVQGSNTFLKSDPAGRLYFENKGRIFRINQDGSLHQLWQNTINSSLHVTDFFIDRSEVLWVSVNAQGLVKVNLQALPFQTYRYNRNFVIDMLEHAGVKPAALPSTWTSQFASYYFHKATIDSNSFFCSLERNKIFLCSNGSMQELAKLPADATFTALATAPGNLLWAFDQKNSIWYLWKDPHAKPELLPVEKGSVNNLVSADARFLDGSIWMSTYSQGLLQFRNGKKVNQFAGAQTNGMMPKELTQICVNPANPQQLWIGSRGSGLVLWDVKQGLQQVFTTDDGLPNNTIYCILADRYGKIWCSTNNGIFRFDPVSRAIIAWSKYDGLQGNEFNRAHKFVFEDGRLAFGGLEGYTILNPADFNRQQPAVKVPVQLTELQVNNLTQDHLQAGSLIDGPLSQLQTIELPYNKNYLRMEFAAMLFNQPQKIKFRYQLKGADAGWIDNGTNNVVSYAALSPGKYSLLINATDNNGNWSEEVKSITVVIRPPFWATWWAWGLYLLLGLLLIRWLLAAREKRLKAEQKLAFEKREALRLREMDEVKDRFFSNITHEFRTPLTLIITPLEKLRKDQQLAPAHAGVLKTVHRNARQLLQLINEFLEFSKLNSGQMKVSLSSGELIPFVQESIAAFDEMAREKNISIHFKAKDVEGHYLFDEDKWEKIIQNLLGNAIRFTPPGGKVELLLTGNGIRVQLQVSDNGPGIPAANQPRIFERFYQADNVQGGTGIGLALVKELAELMNGNVTLFSVPGDTRFVVDLPLQKVTIQNQTAGTSTTSPARDNVNEHAPLMLIAEDNPELRSFLADSMRAQYRVLEAANGSEAWELILQELPDIVVSDVMMPEKDGFDLCQQCKSDTRTAHIGFILLTSKAAPDARLKGLGAGADDYITKPFSQDELSLRVANLLQLQHTLRKHLQQSLLAQEPQPVLPQVTEPFLQQLYSEMEQMLESPQLTVDHLAKVFSMSRSTLNRKLRALLDISPNDLIRQYRLQKAATLLQTGLEISSVAYRVGFSSPSYFSQCFREQFGITPSDFVAGKS